MISKKKILKHDKIAEALGASRVVQFKSRRLGGPLDWLELVQTLQSRLISRGGRPSDPHWDTKRLVPFRRQTWKRLSQEAETISAQGRKVGPAQLAAIVIEERLTPTNEIIPQESAQLSPQIHLLEKDGLLLCNTESVEAEIINLPTVQLSASETSESNTNRSEITFQHSYSDVSLVQVSA